MSKDNSKGVTYLSERRVVGVPRQVSCELEQTKGRNEGAEGEGEILEERQRHKVSIRSGERGSESEREDGEAQS